MKPISAQGQALLDAVRNAEVAPAGTKAALKATLQAKIAAGATATSAAIVTAGSGAVASGAVATGVGLKLAGVLLVAGLGTTAVVATRRPPEPPPVVASATVTPTQPVALPEPEPIAAVPQIPESPAAPPSVRSAPPPRVVPAVAPAPSSAPEPVAEPAVAPPSEPAPEPEVAAPTQEPSTPGCTMPEELENLRQVQQALRERRPFEALRILERTQGTCPGGPLAQEREAMRILALCALGHFDRARVATEALARSAPDSPLLGRIEAACRQ